MFGSRDISSSEVEGVRRSYLHLDKSPRNVQDQGFPCEVHIPHGGHRTRIVFAVKSAAVNVSHGKKQGTAPHPASTTRHGWVSVAWHAKQALRKYLVVVSS